MQMVSKKDKNDHLQARLNSLYTVFHKLVCTNADTIVRNTNRNARNESKKQEIQSCLSYSSYC